MSGISSKSHNNFYCYGCFHSFRTESTLKKHVELCKVELPKPNKNFKYCKPGSKSLKTNHGRF